MEKVKTKTQKVSTKQSNQEVEEIEETAGRHHALMVVCVLLIIIGIIIGCMFSPTFDLNQVIVNNGTNVTSEEILNTFTLERGINVFKINYKEISKKVQSLPYIQSASVKLKFPNSVAIDYVERKPLALIKYLESYLVVDQYGYFLELTKEKKFEDLPIIYNIQFDSYVLR